MDFDLVFHGDQAGKMSEDVRYESNAWDLESDLDAKSRVIKNLNKISKKIVWFNFISRKKYLKTTRGQMA